LPYDSTKNRSTGSSSTPRVGASSPSPTRSAGNRPRTRSSRASSNLYNERPTWLDLAHKRLDEAVFAAYGWPADLTDDDLLARLLALNLERAAAE
jgi:hypothetical protein